MYICTVYLRPLRHEIKQIKFNLFLLVFYLTIQVTPPVPSHRVPFATLTHVVHGIFAWIYALPTTNKNQILCTK